MCIACAEQIIERALTEKGIEKVVADLLSDYDETIKKAWKRESDKAIKKAVAEYEKAPNDEAGYEALIASLATSLAGITNAKDVKRLGVIVDTTYQTLKKDSVEKLGGEFVMSRLDSRLVKRISAEGPYWIGEFYDSHLSARIADVSYQVGVEGGFGRKAAGRTLRDVLTEEFRLAGGPSSYQSTVPARYAGRVGEYSRIVSSSATQRSRVYSSISSFSDSGIKRYQFSAVMDRRTTEVCQEMNGRIFTVASGMDQLNAIAAAETPEEFREVSQWQYSADSIRTIAGSGSDASQSKRLSSAGIQFPPLHGFCRSTVLAID
jgi:SPP1 gp7 family putative phage head morphogenesis protein